MVVDGKKYSADLIIFPHKIISNWWRKEGHSICIDDIEDVLQYNPEILVIGKGANSCMEVSPELKKVFADKNIKLVEEDTQKACVLFNKYISDGKKAVGLFHLTC